MYIERDIDPEPANPRDWGPKYHFSQNTGYNIRAIVPILGHTIGPKRDLFICSPYQSYALNHPSRRSDHSQTPFVGANGQLQGSMTKRYRPKAGRPVVTAERSTSTAGPSSSTTVPFSSTAELSSSTAGPSSGTAEPSSSTAEPSRSAADPSSGNTMDSAMTMSDPHNQVNESSHLEDYIIEPGVNISELSGAALDEALQRACQITHKLAKRKYLEDAEAGRNPAWDPAWDKLPGLQVESGSKRLKLAKIKTFSGRREGDFQDFIQSLEERFAAQDISSLRDKLRVAVGSLDRDLRRKWQTHLHIVFGGNLDSVPEFATFTAWLGSVVATAIRERRRRAFEALLDFQQTPTESYDSYSDRFDSIIMDIPDPLPEADYVTIKLLRMRADLRERTYALGDPVTMVELDALVRRAEFILQYVVNQDHQPPEST